MKLTIELVPRSAWFKNLRSMLPASKWDELRRATYKRVGYVCEICGQKGENHPVECHEKWEYDDEKHVATLSGLFGLCPSCHEVKHMGLAQINGRLAEASQHLAFVNGISQEEAERMIEEAFKVWSERSKHEWTINIDWIEEEK